MDNGLSQFIGRKFTNTPINVLILIVMDNGLSQVLFGGGTPTGECLNPYCNG